MFSMPRSPATSHYEIAVLKTNSLDFVLGEPLLRPVVKLGRARALVRRHLLRVLEPTARGRSRPDRQRAAMPGRGH
jgi:hypothetical protein